MAEHRAPDLHPHLDRDAVTVVLERAHPIASRLTDAGYRVYVVGGLVRDLHLGGGPSTDVDMTTDAEPAAIKAAAAVMRILRQRLEAADGAAADSPPAEEPAHV